MSAKSAVMRNNTVGPGLRPGERASAVVEAAHEDNPGKDVVVTDHVAYIRVSVQGECLLHRETIERHLGRPFILSELEVDLAAIAGQLDVNESRMRFYFNKSE
jgi:toluene monooxygenase system protein D